MDLSGFTGKNVMITGGTGSFGHFMTKVLLESKLNKLVIFSRDQTKQAQMRREFSDPRLKFILGDVRDYLRVEESVADIDLLFHAAAFKIITACEEFPMETVKTDLLGTENVHRACSVKGVERAVFISTDKAAKPISVYGMAKGIAEKVFISQEFDSTTIFNVVRHGNVAGSRDSVIPYFRTLIKEGKPLPITHPKMTRFWITSNEAIELVLTALFYKDSNRILIPELPACTMLELAKAIGGPNYPIEIVGIRPVEKLNECLITEDEMFRTTKTWDNKYFVINPHGYPLGYKTREEYTSDGTRQLTSLEIQELLKNAL